MKQNFYSVLTKEIERIDTAGTTKRREKVIEGYNEHYHALINGKTFRIFNSNDYLGLRFDADVLKADHAASTTYGTGPGSVRFISGTMKVYKDLEKELAQFHGRDDAMVFSSAFATNIAVISCLIKGQSKDSVVGSATMVISDALNHRSIIEGIRVANLPSDQKKIYKHLDFDDLARILEENKGKYQRVVVITDGIFSMLGEYADLKKLQDVVSKYDSDYEEGIITVVDDSHGVGAFGQTGRGCEEISDAQADVLIGTLGKAFGADGGYVVANQTAIDYLRESAATYIYSNTISPSVAGAALEAVETMNRPKGTELLQKLQKNITYFKKTMKKQGFKFAADSTHPIQPVFIGDTLKTKELTKKLFENNILATAISYPVVPAGRDEVRVQINALHTQEDLDYFISTCSSRAKELTIL